MATLTAPDAVTMDSQKLEQVKQLFRDTQIPGTVSVIGGATVQLGFYSCTNFSSKSSVDWTSPNVTRNLPSVWLCSASVWSALPPETMRVR